MFYWWHSWFLVYQCQLVQWWFCLFGAVMYIYLVSFSKARYALHRNDKCDHTVSLQWHIFLGTHLDLGGCDSVWYCLVLSAAVYIKCSDEDTANILRKYTDLTLTLSGSSAVHILVNQTPPDGCAFQTVSAKCETHLLLKVSTFLFLLLLLTNIF